MHGTKNLGAIVRKSRLVDLPDGSTVEIRALILSDWSFLQEEAAKHLKRDLIATYVENADLAPASMRDEMVRDAFKRAESIRADTITSQDAMNFGNSLKGRLLAVWLGMRGAQPHLTYDEAAAIYAYDENKLKEVSNEVAEISSPTLGNETPPQTAGAAA